MIITTIRHGRTRRDSKNLLAHLSKQFEQTSSVVSIGNVPLSDADSAIRYMETMRDASLATVAMHHISISPVRHLSQAEVEETVRRILEALGAEDHPYVLWKHAGKARSSKAADDHYHLVVGHVGPDGKALNDSQNYRKLEAVARSMEVDLGEDLTPSRRTAAVAATLREMGRDDVAEALQAPADLPRSSMSSTTRAIAARKGVDLPKIQAAVRAAWSAADSASAFRNALAEQGLEVRPGKKAGVFIVVAGDVEIGSLDRIAKVKRAEISARMKELVDAAAAEKITAAGRPEGRPGDLQVDANDPRGREKTASAPRAFGGERGAERRPAGGDQRVFGGDTTRPEAYADGDRRPRQKSRRAWRKAEVAVAVRKLGSLGHDARLKALAADLRKQTKPAIERIRIELAERRKAAMVAANKAFTPPRPDDDLRRGRRLHSQAERKVKAAIFATRDSLLASRIVAKSQMPTGIWAWLSGQQAEWRRDVAHAHREIDRIESMIERKMAAASDLVRMNSRMEKIYAAEVTEAQRRHDQVIEKAARQIELLDTAAAILRSNPALARKGLQAVLEAAQERLDAEQRRRDMEALQRLQEARRAVPETVSMARRGPGFR